MKKTWKIWSLYQSIQNYKFTKRISLRIIRRYSPLLLPNFTSSWEFLLLANVFFFTFGQNPIWKFLFSLIKIFFFNPWLFQMLFHWSVIDFQSDEFCKELELVQGGSVATANFDVFYIVFSSSSCLIMHPARPSKVRSGRGAGCLSGYFY